MSDGELLTNKFFTVGPEGLEEIMSSGAMHPPSWCIICEKRGSFYNSTEERIEHMLIHLLEDMFVR